jgi:Protein of unknown function (DUF3892)
MATHRIVCTEQSSPGSYGHGHILAVGTGSDPAGADERWTVQQVRAAIADGTRFYTVSPSTGKVADVTRYDCWCGIKTIRSTPDAVYDNNLDNLRLCNWR